MNTIDPINTFRITSSFPSNGPLPRKRLGAPPWRASSTDSSRRPLSAVRTSPQPDTPGRSLRRGDSPGMVLVEKIPGHSHFQSSRPTSTMARPLLNTKRSARTPPARREAGKESMTSSPPPRESGWRAGFRRFVPLSTPPFPGLPRFGAAIFSPGESRGLPRTSILRTARTPPPREDRHPGRPCCRSTAHQSHHQASRP